MLLFIENMIFVAMKKNRGSRNLENLLHVRLNPSDRASRATSTPQRSTNPNTLSQLAISNFFHKNQNAAA
jgi:hypothetical protein